MLINDSFIYRTKIESIFYEPSQANLTSSLAYLTDLPTPQLSHNLFVGHISKTLSQIPNLQQLDLFGNNFSSEIPTSFEEFQHLETLNLIENLLNAYLSSRLISVDFGRESGLRWISVLCGFWLILSLFLWISPMCGAKKFKCHEIINK